MNAISKATIKASLVLWLLLLSSCVQGPWDFWPENPPTHRGIWVYAHLVVDKPVRNICFDIVIPLNNANTRDFAFYDSASVQISGEFNNGNRNLVLQPQAESPNCFDDTTLVTPIAGGNYSLNATIRWDSAGTKVTTNISASTTIPTQFKLGQGFANPLGDLGKVLNDTLIYPMILQVLGDTAEYLRDYPDTRDTFQGENQNQIFGLLGSYRIPFASGDTLRIMNPPLDLQTHLVLTSYSDDVKGLLLTSQFDSTTGKGGSTFDNFFGGNVDTTTKWESGETHRIFYAPSQVNPVTGHNLIDTVSIINSYFYYGENRFYVFAANKEYNDYVNASINGAQDSRIRPVTNIQGGQGIFTGFIVDSVIVHVKPLPNSKYYSNTQNRIAFCELKSNWTNEQECRNYIPTYCKESMETKKACAPYAISMALDSALQWNALFPTADDSAKVQGERMWCRQNDFPNVDRCTLPRQESIVSVEKTTAMQELINSCSDRGWPIETFKSCGNALAAWIRVDAIKSSTLTRVRNEWCNTNKTETQCTY